MKIIGYLNTGFSARNIWQWASTWSHTTKTAKRQKKILVVIEMTEEELQQYESSRELQATGH